MIRLIGQSFTFYRRTNFAVTIGVAVGTAALTGALLVGDSMRGSLRETAIGRLGRIDKALLSIRFVREELVGDLAHSSGESGAMQLSPAILLNGAATQADGSARANHVQIIGVTESFWKLSNDPLLEESAVPAGRKVVLNGPLARALRAQRGDDVLVRVGKPKAISSETLLGRRNDTTATLRLTVMAVIPADDIGAFSLSPRHAVNRNAYIPLDTLQRSIDRPGRVNAILADCDIDPSTLGVSGCDDLAAALQRRVTLPDLGLRLRPDAERGYVALESERMLIEPAVESAARAAADTLGATPVPSLTYLANRIAKGPAAAGDLQAAIPYSTVTAIDPAMTRLEWTAPRRDAGAADEGLQPGEILLNQWSAADLNANPGDPITLTYYVTGPFGRLESNHFTFRLRGVVALRGEADDPGWVPEYKGVTDTDNLADWEPPFPMDLSVIREKDEQYWDDYRTAPKAFVTLVDGERLWTEDADRFGRYTSIRLPAGSEQSDIAGLASRFEHVLLDEIDPASMGLVFDPVRQQMIAAGAGTTDFGGLFIGFSFFLIAASAMLVALLFRLGVERRAVQIGLLAALGFTPRYVTGLLVAEGALTAVIGGGVGLAASLGYAQLMLAGLRTWWSQAVSAPFLRLHVSSQSVSIGLSAGILLAVCSIAWSIHGLSRVSPSALLAGSVASRGQARAAKVNLARWVAPTGFVVALMMIALTTGSDVLPQAIAFFLCGAALLVGGLALFALRLRRERAETVIHRPGSGAMVRLGVRNAMRHRGRSILTAGLIASATFLIAALDAFYLDPDAPTHERRSGTGGFTLLAEAASPLLYDLNSTAGREALNLAPEASDRLSDVSVVGFRLRPGDESSCVNLYRPTNPRILGAGESMIQRGGFDFSGSLAESDTERRNPWMLLKRSMPDGAVPVIGDEAAVKWQLHLGLGQDLVIQDDRGRDVHLRFVALLAGSILQDELIVADSHFVRLFPTLDGHAFFLMDVSPEKTSSVETMLEQELEDYGFDVQSTTERLAAYLAVQNTYLSTFQMLGGFGLILGTVGLGAVMLRNVWERRGELALMRAVGFSRLAIGAVVLSENTLLLVVGLAIGSLAAAVAIAPHVMTRPGTIPWLSLGLTLLAVFATGLIAGVVAVVPTLRAPVIPSLRRE